MLFYYYWLISSFVEKTCRSLVFIFLQDKKYIHKGLEIDKILYIVAMPEKELIKIVGSQSSIYF